MIRRGNVTPDRWFKGGDPSLKLLKQIGNLDFLIEGTAGDAVVFQDDRRIDFHALLTKRGWLMASFVALDLLHLNGDDLRQRPLEKRRDAPNPDGARSWSRRRRPQGVSENAWSSLRAAP